MKSEAFNGRIQRAETFRDAVFTAIAAMTFDIAINGTEHTHPQFVEKLRRSIDQTSLAIRYQPDGVACIGDIPCTIYIETKDANTIERQAYEQYMKLYQAGNRVVVIFGGLAWAWNFIECIKLIPGEDTVARFPPERQFPVREHWITPRESAWWRRICQRNPQASGTPYREVEKQSLLPWQAFYTLCTLSADIPQGDNP